MAVDRSASGSATEAPAAAPTDGDAVAASSELFSPVALGRVSEVIVDQIRLLIRQGKLRPGDRLPAERDLCERFGVSRVTVREALRVLEAGGLIDIKVGARGGAFVTAPSREQVGEGIADYLTLSEVSALAATEARMVLEVGIIPLVCERATDADLDDLAELVREAHTAIDAGKYDMSMSAAFHSRIAACTHNGAIELLVQSMQGPLRMSLEEARIVAPQMGVLGADEHGDFVEAIRRRDVDSATEIMRTHLERTAGRLKTNEDGQERTQKADEIGKRTSRQGRSRS
jgi:DNA-binding FadR family transcriptional regulator